jgi:large subunit ribosomal protein L14e
LRRAVLFFSPLANTKDVLLASARSLITSVYVNLEFWQEISGKTSWKRLRLGKMSKKEQHWKRRKCNVEEESSCGSGFGIFSNNTPALQTSLKQLSQNKHSQCVSNTNEIP